MHQAPRDGVIGMWTFKVQLHTEYLKTVELC